MRAAPHLAISFIVGASALVNEYVSRSNFEDFLTFNDRHLVLFTSRTLTSVQTHTTTFKYADRSRSTRFMSIDCDTEVDLCKEYDINSYPTIRHFEISEDGTDVYVTRYRGPRTEGAIRGFVKRRELPVVTEIEGAKVEEFKGIDDVVVLAYLPPDNPGLLEAFASVAQIQHLEYVFGYTTDASLAMQENLSVPSIKVYKNSDNDHRILSGPFTAASLTLFLETALPSVVKDFREKDIETFMQRDKLTLYIFLAPSPLISSSNTIRHTLTPLAKKYKKFVTFAVADLDKHADMATNFFGRFAREVQGKKTGVVVHAPLNDNVFRYELGKKIEARRVEEMLKTILQGKAKSGDVFRGEADDEAEDEAKDEEAENGHDEL